MGPCIDGTLRYQDCEPSNRAGKWDRKTERSESCQGKEPKGGGHPWVERANPWTPRVFCCLYTSSPRHAIETTLRCLTLAYSGLVEPFLFGEDEIWR